MKGINLLPPEIIEKRLTERRWVYFFAIMIALVALFGFIYAVTYGREFTENSALEEIKAANRQLESKIAVFKIFEARKSEVLRREAIINKAIGGEISWYRLLNEVSMLIPSEVCLSDLNLDQTGGIKMNCFTTDYSSVAKWLVRLGEIRELTEIWIETASKSTQEGENVITFSITAKLAGPAASGQPAPSN